MDTDAQKALTDRLSRAEGQIRALKRALEEDKIDCKHFIAQVKAARSALKAVSEQFIIHHITTCQALPEHERDQQVEEAVKLLTSE